MKLLLLGSGVGAPTMERSSTSYFLKTDKTRVLVDPGPGAVQRLVNAGEDYRDLDGLLFTHFHADHSADLPALIHALLYTPGYAWTHPLTVHGPRDLADFVSNFFVVYPSLAKAEDRLRLIEDEEIFAMGEIAVSTARMEHAADLHCRGYRFEVASSVIALSGDTGPCTAVTELAREADLFLCESSRPAALPSDHHLTAREAGAVAGSAGVKRLVLTHLYPDLSGEQALAEAKEGFEGPVEVGRDGTWYAPR